VELEVLTLSKVGGREHNEDACGIWHNEATCCLVLCDGAGGHDGGAVASQLAVRHALTALQSEPFCDVQCVEHSLNSANNAIVAEQAHNVALHGMRTTVVLLVIDTVNQLALWGHLGDSRLYYFRDGRIRTQTRDHSVVQSLVDTGYMTAADLRSAPQRNQLLAALGDPLHFEPALEHDAMRLRDHDAFLLCSDGFWEYVLEAEMESTLAAADSVEAWLSAMESYVIERGGARQDNYSAIAVLCNAPAERTLPGELRRQILEHG
jgi:serine/threonine protein phosphatase PrpC